MMMSRSGTLSSSPLRKLHPCVGSQQKLVLVLTMCHDLSSWHAQGELC